jgi:hypothetical protein
MMMAFLLIMTPKVPMMKIITLKKRASVAISVYLFRQN